MSLQTIPKSDGQPSACWHNGKLIPLEQACVSVFDHGLLYGDGVFEGLRFYHRKVFKLDRHLTRLRHSCRALALSLSFSDSELADGLLSCMDEAQLDNGYIRILVTRGEGNLGLNPEHCRQPNVFILLTTMELVSTQKRFDGLNLITASTRRMTGSGLDTRIKSLNYLHSVMAKMEANYAGADDAVLLNQHGFIAECSAANLFAVKNNLLTTPPCSDGALAGITRETVLQLARELSMTIELASMTPWDIYTADECFISGSAARLVPVKSLDGRQLKYTRGNYFEKIHSAFSNRVKQ